MDSIKRLLAYVQGFSQTSRQELCSMEPCGVGMELECNSSSGEWAIAAVRPGGPADLSKTVRPGDVVVSVEWSPIQGRSESEVNQLLFGREGTSITIEVMSPSGGRRHATMVRVRADIGDLPSVALIEDKAWGVLCCKT
uniref:PDZ domain-containing protein n=1 Tax=Cryptomonas curvata TaxID=233186 RepID=A0A7S0Q8W3_9CRYP|mmetsp:Transcript_12517/g.26878  ORF Transcript_12517/g.26878 Transcript_12517/m.26878 type:complete len:139 (+) Transcript_12517:18-434(+)|eukprot:CAMPEP_0172183720 /NCGR_PEP_ID=MMETSP1050-20130122/19154_1 /TAXON_ID=233186 /ORGANISM="Cryptomonas curvata, Strain CCAP979/52" /LENGTH=138 /DNA_ID=CAMNT_0012857393 /DNA_START=18 /DNA_END=434 /DNA_ORIENTATION=-